MAFSREEFAKRLRKRRRELDITQASLAEMTGLTADLIWNYENGTYTPGADKMYLLAEALGCDMNYLCGLSCAED